MMSSSRLARSVLRRPLPISSWNSPRSSYHTTGVLMWDRKELAVASEIKIHTKFDLPEPAGTGDGTGTETRVKPLQLTKIVATIGPTSEQINPMTQVVKGGMRIMRLNFSHATKEEVELRCTNLDLAEDSLSPTHAPEKQKIRAVLLDTCGPEIRTGKLMKDHSGHETMTLNKGDEITLRTAPKYEEQGSTETDLFVNYPSLHKSLNPGMKVLLDDGAIILTVQKVDSDKEFYGDVICTIDNSGELRSRAGVNLPMAETDLPAMSDKDKADIKYGMTKDIDFIAASFVQNAAGVNDIRRFIKECAYEAEYALAYPLPKIISKIESASALINFDEILEASDGIMVARGDLGVEVPLHQVTNFQKEIVAACNAVGKPVIVATQMLESMAKNPRPTRAEVSDVTNAVYDGADAVMLSGETAKGKYPVDAVKMMNEIILSAEKYATSGGLGSLSTTVTPPFVGPKTPESSIAKGAVTAAEERGASAIIVLSNELRLPQLVSAYRPNVPILVVCPSSKMARQLILHRAIHPIVGLSGVSPAKLPAAAVHAAKNMDYVEAGQSVILLSLDDDGLGHCETMQVVTVPEAEE